LWIVLAASLWAAYALTQKALLQYFTSFDIMLFIYGAGSFILLPKSMPLEIANLSGIALLLLAFCCLNTLFAYGAFAEALAHWEASRVSAILSLTPLLTILFMHITHYFYANYMEVEPLNQWSLIGAVMVVTGSMTTALARRVG
jgi:drug/metabolite transporter (DMT)-like permease